MSKISFGIILFKRKPFLQLLLIQKHCTYYFVKLVNGFLNNKNLKYYFNKMTNTEKNLILLKDYELLYKYAFYSRPKEKNAKKIKNYFKKIFHNKNLLEHVKKSKNGALPWEFPKGRKELKECDITCAKREVLEETLIVDFKILDKNPLILSVIDDNVIYTSKLFAAEITNDIEKKFNISPEVNDYQWFSAINDLKGTSKIIFDQAYEYINNLLFQQQDDTLDNNPLNSNCAKI